jgi:hypothetical protein
MIRSRVRRLWYFSVWARAEIRKLASDVPKFMRSESEEETLERWIRFYSEGTLDIKRLREFEHFYDLSTSVSRDRTASHSPIDPPSPESLRCRAALAKRRVRASFGLDGTAKDVKSGPTE